MTTTLVIATRVQSTPLLAAGNLLILPIGAALVAAGRAFGKRDLAAQWVQSEQSRSATELE